MADIQIVHSSRITASPFATIDDHMGILSELRRSLSFLLLANKY
jgi:hypothetical protein